MNDPSLIKREKVAKYESFLSERLQPDLIKVLTKRDQVYEQTSEYLKLKAHIELIQTQNMDDIPMRAMVNVGCDFFMQAEVEDTDNIFVNVGLDCHVRFTLEEALGFIDRKEKQLTKRGEVLTEEALKIKSHIKLVLAAIQEVLES
ncbi:hypothetical protein HDU81_007567 [Chytriomyces hyalinus]|nr:hypothetical protein HDU81_007567 [Chytriomyces hyalinus]